MPWNKPRPEPEKRSHLDVISDYVIGMQRDGRLLLRHIARRSDFTLQAAGPAGLTADDSSSRLLFESPDTIAKDSQAIADLVSCVDHLSRQAAPTNVRSIRLTCSYLDMTPEDGEPPTQIKREAAGVKNAMRFIGLGLAVPLLLLSILILFHVDYGRRILGQLDALRKQEAVLRDVIAKSPLADWELQPGRDGAGTSPAGAQQNAKADGKTVALSATTGGGESDTKVENGARRCPAKNSSEPFSVPKTQAAAELCRQYVDLEQRLQLAYVGFADWNCRTSYPFDFPAKLVSWVTGVPPATNGCARPLTDLPDDVTLLTWKSHDSRVSNMIGVIGGFVLPLLLGCAGGCASVLRRHVDKLRSWTLEPYDGRSALVRVALAAILGGLVGAIWSPDQPLSISGFSLSLAALAFFVGFSVEIVFKLIERITTSVAATFQDQPISPPPPPPAVVRPSAGVAAGSGSPQLTSTTTAATPGDGQGKLRDLRDRLADIRGIAQVAGTLGVGTEIMSGADKVLSTADRLIGAVNPLLSGQADAGAVAAVIESVGKELGPLENLGLPGTLADGIAAIRGVADVAGPIIAGIPGGPIGIVGGIVMAGVQLAQNHRQFEAFKTAILSKPFDPDLMPAIVVDGNAARAALDSAPQIKALLDKDGAAAATDLMRKVLRRAAGGQLPVTVAEVTSDILANGLDAGGATVRLDGRCTPVQLTEALMEYRGTVLFQAASSQVQGKVALPAVGGEPARDIEISGLLTAARDLTRRVPQAGAQIEKLMFLAEALGKVTDRGGGGMAGLIGPALGLAVNLLPQRADRRAEQ